MVKVKTSAKAGSKASPASVSAKRSSSARGSGGGKPPAGTAKVANGRIHMGQAGSTGVKATVPAKTGKTQPRQTADIAVAAKTVKPTARTKGAIQSSTSGKVSTSMSTSARPGGTAASVALKGKTTTVAKSKVTEVESKQTPASQDGYRSYQHRSQASQGGRGRHQAHRPGRGHPHNSSRAPRRGSSRAQEARPQAQGRDAGRRQQHGRD